MESDFCNVYESISFYDEQNTQQNSLYVLQHYGRT